MVAFAPIEIRPGDLVRLDPEAALYYEFRVENLLADGVTINDFEIQIERFKYSGTVNLLESSEEAKTTDDRNVRFMLDGRTGTIGVEYLVALLFSTNETPERRPRLSFKVLIQRG